MFGKALAARDTKQQDAAENDFFLSLVQIHRAGEGAPFTGLKPAGEVEPVIAEADGALAAGSPATLTKMISDAVDRGIRQRYEKAALALRHQDESVQKGRDFVSAYIEYTHYVERLHNDAVGASADHGTGKEHVAPRHNHGHD
jgi:hypothetical protein